MSPPQGIRDLLPPESRARRTVANRLQHVFARYGYELVTTPLFERATVFENSASLVDSRDLVRFVEPETGDVLALRPDITPQIARVVATRLAEHPAPWRIRYEGSVIRRRRGRARKQRQIAQAGIEHIGVRSTQADVEVVTLIAAACEKAGLEDFKVELSHVGIGHALLADLDPAALAEATAHLARKDETLLESTLKAAGTRAADRRRVLALTALHGDPSQLKRAEKLMRGTRGEKPLRRLQRVVDELAECGMGSRLVVDLGEVRGGAYYTGTSFQFLAAGPGEAVAAGGRYDRLVRHYGRAEPAVGAAIDVENLLWALDHQGTAWRRPPEPRFALAGGTRATAMALGNALREAQCVAATLPASSASDLTGYAQAWAYDVALWIKGDRMAATRISDKARRTFRRDALAELVAWARPEVKG